MRVATILKAGTRYSRGDNKLRFHRAGKALLRRLVKELGLPKGSYEVRSNYGGMAVSGEVTLHTGPIRQSDLGLYVQIADYSGAGTLLFRTCAGPTDYVGGCNHYGWVEEIEDHLPEFAEKLLFLAGATEDSCFGKIPLWSDVPLRSY
jgi:hypothetical protein